MRKIKDVIIKPSQAVRAMIDGLKEQSEREDFIIDMSTYGVSGSYMCYGCAATCAVQKIAGKNLDINTIRSHRHGDQLGFDNQDIDEFEYTIDCLRMGDYASIFVYFGMPRNKIPYIDLPTLTSNSWQKGLPAYEQFAIYLEELGL